MKDLILGFSHDLSWDTLKIWINSINELKIDAEKAIIIHNASKEMVQKIESAGFKIYSPSEKQSDGSYKFNVEDLNKIGIQRFGEMWSFLRLLKNKFRYILVTGSKDVYFQKNPFEYIDKIFMENLNKSIIIGAEPSIVGVGWNSRHVNWTFGPLVFDHIKNEKVLNPDVLCGKSEDLIDFLAILYFVSNSTGMPGSDQSALPLLASFSFLKEKIFIPNYEDAWTLHHALFLDSPEDHALDTYPLIKNNKIYSSKSNKEYYLVHQYNRDSKLNNLIQSIYGE